MAVFLSTEVNDPARVPDRTTTIALNHRGLRLGRVACRLPKTPSSITEISYGQDVHRRVGAAVGLAVVTFGLGALLAFSKSKKHFIGVTYANGDQKGGFVMQCDKDEYRGILMALEGITGKKSVNSDAMTVKN